MNEISLKIVTPTGAFEPIACDSVHLNVGDDKLGKGGGSYGIRKGHVDSMLLLCSGTLTAFLGGKCIFTAETGSGFATVENNTVTVTVENCIKK